MSWLSEDWKFRLPLSVVNTAGAGTIDISAPFPKDYDLFWSNVLASGADIRLTEADGTTLVSAAAGTATAWDLGAVAFNSSTRTFTLRVDNWTGAASPATAALQLYLYWGNAAAVSTVEPVGALAGALTGIFATRSAASFPRRILTSLESTGATTPAAKFQKGTTEIVEIAWDFSRELSKRDTTYQGSNLLEELQYVEVSGGQGTTAVPAIFDTTRTRFLRNNVVITHHIAGSDLQNYWLEAKATTTLGQRLQRRCEMRVRNVVQT